MKRPSLLLHLKVMKKGPELHQDINLFFYIIEIDISFECVLTFHMILDKFFSVYSHVALFIVSRRSLKHKPREWYALRMKIIIFVIALKNHVQKTREKGTITQHHLPSKIKLNSYNLRLICLDFFFKYFTFSFQVFVFC